MHDLIEVSLYCGATGSAPPGTIIRTANRTKSKPSQSSVLYRVSDHLVCAFPLVIRVSLCLSPVAHVIPIQFFEKNLRILLYNATRAPDSS